MACHLRVMIVMSEGREACMQAPVFTCSTTPSSSATLANNGHARRCARSGCTRASLRTHKHTRQGWDQGAGSRGSRQQQRTLAGLKTGHWEGTGGAGGPRQHAHLQAAAPPARPGLGTVCNNESALWCSWQSHAPHTWVLLGGHICSQAHPVWILDKHPQALGGCPSTHTSRPLHHLHAPASARLSSTSTAKHTSIGGQRPPRGTVPELLSTLSMQGGQPGVGIFDQPAVCVLAAARGILPGAQIGWRCPVIMCCKPCTASGPLHCGLRTASCAQ